MEHSASDIWSEADDCDTVSERTLFRIAIVGSRGIPASYGGFETFAEELSVKLKNNYVDNVFVICDAEQKQKNNVMKEYKGVQLLYSRFKKGKNPILFYLESILIGIKCSDILLACGTGGGYWSFIPSLFGKIFATNPDGIGWRRAKWSLSQKIALKSMYYFSAKFSDYFVCDSLSITKIIKEKFSYNKSYTIEYGAHSNPFIGKMNEQVEQVLDRYGLESRAYHLVVSRLEPENNISIIVEAYVKKKRKYPLVVIGNRRKTDYVKMIQNLANNDVLFLDGIYIKDVLSIVRANALDYIHGHSVGGTNPSLLEAMASASLCVCHDNEFNREVVQDNGFFFSSVESLSDIIDNIESNPSEKFNSMRHNATERVNSLYNWELIAEKYFNAFREMLDKKKRKMSH